MWLAGNGPSPILREASFAFAAGSFHCLTGGPGKTALLRLIALMDRPSQGAAWVFGRDIAKVEASEAVDLRRRIGVSLHPTLLPHHLTVRENLALPAQVTGRDADEAAGEVDQLLAWIGLLRRADGAPTTLSAAERNRLALARALINRPELLLIDEPFTGADQEGDERILRMLEEVNKAGATVIVAAREPGLLAERDIVGLTDGRLTPAGIVES